MRGHGLGQERQHLLPQWFPGRSGRGGGRSRLEPTALRAEATWSSLDRASVLARGPRGGLRSSGGSEPHPCTSEMPTPGTRPRGARRGRGRLPLPDPTRPARPSSRARAPASHAEGRPPRAPAWPSPGRAPGKCVRTAAFLTPWLGLRESPMGRLQAEPGTGGQGRDRGGHNPRDQQCLWARVADPSSPLTGLPAPPHWRQPGALGSFCSEPQGLCCCCFAWGQPAG